MKLYTKMSNMTRNSSVELIKIIALILIVMSHSIPSWIPDLKYATRDLDQMVAIIILYGGQIGNAIFVICSAYFLVDDTAFKPDKIVYLLIDSFTISVSWLCIALVNGVDLSVKEVFKQFFPITFNSNWFVVCYIIYYAIHPLLNIIINKLDKWKLLQMNSILFIAYCGINSYWQGSYYYTELVGFICIHFWVAYMKKHLVEFNKSRKNNLILIIIGFLGFMALIGVTNILGLKMSAFEDGMLKWRQFINPFIILIGLGAVNLSTSYQWTNRCVNYVAKLSLLIYLISENYLWRTYIRGRVWDLMYHELGMKNVILGIGVMSLIQGGIALMIGIIYKNIACPVIYNLGMRMVTKVSKVYGTCLEKIYELR